MRGRRGHASSSVSQEQLGMALRNQAVTDAGDVPCGSQQTEENTQQNDDNDELSCSLLTPSSSRDKRRRERENRSKPREMTEEEMMDLALRLSEQEASRTALRLQREEEAVMSAIRESMVGQTQPCPPSHSLVDAESALRSCSRRKLSYSNGKPDESEDDCTQTELHSGKRGGAEIKNQHKKRKRKEGSPLQEMPDLSQTQKIQSQASSGSETLDLPLDSPQSVDSTQIDDCPLRKSPVFPATGCRAEVHVSRLSQDLLQTCRTSGFVLCSQDGWTSPPTSLLSRPRSPTFPSSRRRSADLDTTSPKSSVSSEAEQGGDGAPSPEPFKSPVFGRSSQQEMSPSACRPQVSACTSGFTLSSHESLSSSVRSCPTHSPVFTRTPGRSQDPPPPETSEAHRGADISEAYGGQSEKSPEISRVHAARPPPAEDPSRLRQAPDSESDPDEDLLLQSDEELKEVTEEPDSAERELTSDMTLLWSDEDDDVTPVVSPSPVFPDERPLNHVTAAAPATNCRSSTGRQQREQQPIRSQGMSGEASAPPGEHASRSTVHYYWGVPFCPRGLDPDRYTQVILAQMEVYEKSLKQAQRRLLRKAEWGEAVLPQPEKSPSPESPADSPEQLFTHRHGLRLRGRTLCDEAETPPAEDEGEEKQEEEEEKKNDGEEETQVDDCEVCPETQMSNDDRTQDLMTDAGAAAQCPQLPPESPEPPEVQIVVRDDSPAGDEQVEVDETRQTEGNVTDDVRGEEGGGGPDVEEVKDGGHQTSPSPDLEPAIIPQSPETSVDCPICQGSFPVTQIELHAAYCDGEVAVVDERKPEADGYHVSPKPRRRRRRRAEAAADDTDGASNTARNQEKCFICQREVPLREYSRHTELCIQRQTAKTSAKGNLLSALEETESRDSEAGTSGSKPPPGDVIDLRDDDDEEDGGVSAVRISNSPIRSFTPISEATGCLIDFKKQQRPKKLSHRRR